MNLVEMKSLGQKKENCCRSKVYYIYRKNDPRANRKKYLRKSSKQKGDGRSLHRRAYLPQYTIHEPERMAQTKMVTLLEV